MNMEKPMKKPLVLTVAFILMLAALTGQAKPDCSTDIIEQIRPSVSDLPEGFMFGRIPGFAQKVLKGNPWLMDRRAMKRLASRIYPDGDFSKMSAVHMTIMADTKTPFGDDIVCYIIVYRDKSSAKGEIKKLLKFAGYNNDRVLVLSKENMVVFLHVDDTINFHHIQELAGKMGRKLEKIPCRG